MKFELFKSIRYGSILTQIQKRNINNFNLFNFNNYRSLINVKGTEASKFLQGLVTNDVHHLDSIDNRIMYSMILNNRGRVMFDVFVYCVSQDNTKGPHYLVEVDAKHANDALKYLNIFRLKRKVEISDANNEYKLFSAINKSESEDLLETVDKPNNIIICQVDSRYKRLGYRIITKNSPSIQPSQIIKNTKEFKDILEYKKFLFKNGVAEGSEAIPYGNAIPLEYNLVFLNGVSFNKGCYLGQELVAKTHHTGVIRKRIMPLEIISNGVLTDISTDNSIVNTQSGQAIGKLRTFIGNYGLALMRLSKIDNKNMSLIDNKGVRHQVKTHLPKYWQLDEALTNELKTSDLN